MEGEVGLQSRGRIEAQAQSRPSTVSPRRTGTCMLSVIKHIYAPIVPTIIHPKDAAIAVKDKAVDVKDNLLGKTEEDKAAEKAKAKVDETAEKAKELREKAGDKAKEIGDKLKS